MLWVGGREEKEEKKCESNQLHSAPPKLGANFSSRSLLMDKLSHSPFPTFKGDKDGTGDGVGITGRARNSSKN